MKLNSNSTLTCIYISYRVLPYVSNSPANKSQWGVSSGILHSPVSSTYLLYEKSPKELVH